MLYRTHKSLPVLFVLLTLVMSASAQTFNYQTLANIESETTRLLLEKDVGEVANQLARAPRATTVVPLLRRLTIFARAGHRARVLQTLNQLMEATDMPPISERWVVAEAVRQMIGTDDLAALRAYYERIMPIDASTAEPLLRLWEKEGNTKELDSWLAARAKQQPEWIRWRIQWRASLGTADELVDALAAEVKANPEDRMRLSLYLQAVGALGRRPNLSWLNDVLAPRHAYESYELAMLLRTYAPESAAKLLERSLTQPFTADDMQLINERLIPRYQIPPHVKNWEKQLRFWTKLHLAEIYRAIKQPQAAQIIIEELVAMKDDDLIRDDIYQLAGAVQADSGMRVVEAKILRDEEAGRESVSYWMERARYYIGRKEYTAAMETYRSAFAHLPFKPQDEASVRARLGLLKEFVTFAATRDITDEKSPERRAEAEQLLWREFNAASPETSYAFGVATIISDHQYDFDELMDSLFVSQMNVIPRLLAARSVWTYEEERLIDNIVSRSSLTPEQKANYWTQLEVLTRNSSPSRAFRLASAMVSGGAPRRAIPLLINYLEQIRGRSDVGDDVNEWQTVEKLFTAYLYSDDWQAAEKLLFERADLRETQIMYDLSRISLVAARVGAVNDAVRLWRMKSNLDRRSLGELKELAATPAKEPLRQMYAQMKKKDPLSSVPDIALKVLQ